MIKLKCRNCGTINEFEDNQLAPEVVGTDDRQMGTEIAYFGVIFNDCKKCKNLIRAEFNFWEYPQKSLNYTENKATGCYVIQEPDYVNSYFYGNEQLPEREREEQLG